MDETGWVYWVTGLSGAGKTTLGRLLRRRIRERGRACVLLDGDSVREVFGNDLGHSLPDRRANAFRNSRLCQLIALQGVDVVCATISLFHAIQGWNRRHISKYREIYLRAPLPVLIQRDPKQLYRRALLGEESNVVGIDLPFEEPERPDVVVEVDDTRSPEEIVELLCHHLGIVDSEEAKHGDPHAR